MPTVAIYDIANKKVGDLELNESIFGVEINEALLHQAVVMQLASQRLGTHVGDTVSLMETRPLSKNKRWRVVEVLERAK